MILTAEHLVSYTQHRGYVTTSLDTRDLTQTYRLRELLETEAIAQALPNIGPAELEQMRQAAEVMESDQQIDNRKLVDLNRQFHFLLFSATRNDRLIGLLGQLWDAWERYRSLYYAEQAARDRVHREHRLIIDACAAADLELVQELVRQHRESGLAEALQVFEMQHSRVPSGANLPRPRSRR